MTEQKRHPDDRTLVALAAGLLPADAEDAARVHLAACGGCAVRWQALLAGREAEGAGERHLPAAMIARWDRAQAQLHGLERDLVRQHLDRCPACREELRAVGYEPVLGAGRNAGVRWPTLGLAGGAALAAVLVFALLGPWDLAGRQDGAAGDPGGATGGAVVPWVAPGQFRGDPARVDLPAGARAVSLMVGAPASLDTARRATVTVTGPGGAVLLESPAMPSALATGTLVVLLQTAEPLAAGVYAVTLEQAGAPGAAGLAESFTFRVAPGEPSR